MLGRGGVLKAKPPTSWDICCLWGHGTMCGAHSGRSLLPPIVGGVTGEGGSVVLGGTEGMKGRRENKMLRETGIQRHRDRTMGVGVERGRERGRYGGECSGRRQRKRRRRERARALHGTVCHPTPSATVPCCFSAQLS